MNPDDFEFWLGEGDCVWEGGRGTNSIERILDGKIIQESFESLEPHGWTGLSVSSHDAHSGDWHQTWVDSNGSYWHFVGGRVDGDPSFGTPVPVDRDLRYKRMIFSDIGPAGFDWRWESSPDGEDWEVAWQIRYTRRA